MSMYFSRGVFPGPVLVTGPSIIASATGAILRVGTAAVENTTDVFTFLQASTAPTSSPRGGIFRTRMTSDAATTGSMSGLVADTERVITLTNIKDTVTMVAFRTRNRFTVPAGQTYTANSATALEISAIGAPTGTLGIDLVKKLDIIADSTATGTRKTGIKLGLQSGATNNAGLADNDAYTGDYFIHQSGTTESLFGGVVNASAGGIRTKVSIADMSNPPTNAELVSAFGAAATVGAGFSAIVDDNNGHANEYFVWSDGTKYWYVAGTAAP